MLHALHATRLPTWLAAGLPLVLGALALLLKLPVTLVLGSLLLSSGLVGWWSARYRTAQAQVQQILADLAEARGHREAFMARAAHELRTPLTINRLVVQRELHALRRAAAAGTCDAAGQRRLEGLELTDQAIDRMARTVNAMLTDAQLASGQTVVRLETCDLQEVVCGAVARQCLLWPERLLVVRTPDQPVWVRGDRERLHQVVDHLVHNAVKYSESSTPVSVLLYLVQDSPDAPATAEVVVVDQGVGIPLAEQQAIWSRFHQVEGGLAPGAPSQLGLGLGLHLVRMLLDQQDGRYGVRSAPGTGSSFWFRLPLTPPTTPAG